MEVINHPNAHLIKNIEPVAKNMFPLQRNEWQKVSLRMKHFVPFYLKDFVAKQAKPLL